MKLLVLEQSDRIINIFKKFFKQKDHSVEFVTSPDECLNKLKDAKSNEFDHIILERPGHLIYGVSLEDMIKEIIHLDIRYLFPHTNSENGDLSKETIDIIEKPFAMVTLLGQLQLKSQEQIFA